MRFHAGQHAPTIGIQEPSLRLVSQKCGVLSRIENIQTSTFYNFGDFLIGGDRNRTLFFIFGVFGILAQKDQPTAPVYNDFSRERFATLGARPGRVPNRHRA